MSSHQPKYEGIRNEACKVSGREKSLLILFVGVGTEASSKK